MNEAAIKLAVTGMDHRSQLLFTKTVQLQLQGICRIVDVQEAEVVLIDMDSANSEEYWISLKDNFPELPVIALSIRPVNEKNTLYLRKPIKINSLITTLRILFPKRFMAKGNEFNKQKNVDGQCSNKQDKSLNARTTIADVFNNTVDKSSNVVALSDKVSPGECILDVFDASSHLIYYVMQASLQAKALKKLAKISLWNGRIILCNFSPNVIITNVSEGMLRSLAIVQLNESQTKITIEHVEPDILDTINPKKDPAYKELNVESFIWQLALLTARGRVPLELHDNMFFVDKPVYMEYWPNLTRLMPVPYAQQITALLVLQPRTFKEISKTLAIDVKHVADLFFAAAMIGCAGQAKRPADKLFAPFEVEQHKHRKVLSSIMNRLRSIAMGNAQSA
ncbi:MAG: hypothetical protein PVF82_06215 [Gammaproteobacteria bacterium]|jgi:hypothetical protein